MLKAFKYQIYPTDNQAILINKHIGSTRFVYNLALETKITAYRGSKVNIDCFTLNKQLPALKEDCQWLKEINAKSLQYSIRNLDKAFSNFFKGESKFPKFKKKINYGSFNVPQYVKLIDNRLIFTKFNEGINIVLHRPIKGEIKNATISKTPTGKYFASILCETGEECIPKVPIKEESTTGIDLGIKTFIVSSNGKEYANPRFLKNNLSKLKFIQRKYSKHKGKRTKHNLALLHEKVANQRKDFLHKVSSELIKNHDSIAIETLKVSNMMKNHTLAQSIQDAGWGMFVDMLEYKAKWNGKNILKIGAFEPSSKTCSCCGNVNKELTLSDREWTCSNCDTLLDRDLNAAINIKNFALKDILSVGNRLENHDELPTLVGVMTHEA